MSDGGALRLTDPLFRAKIRIDLNQTGEVTMTVDEAIRQIITTELRHNFNDGAAYRRIAVILRAIGRGGAAEICVAGSLLKAIPPEMVDLSAANPLTVDEAAAAPAEGLRKFPLYISTEPDTPYARSRSWNDVCPPNIDARPRRAGRPHFVAEIAGGRCLVGNVAYAVFTRTGAYLTDFCGNDGRLLGAAAPDAAPPVTHLSGTVICLPSAYGNGNFHWMLEVLPRFLLLRAAGFDPAKADHILTRPLFPYQIDALRLLGVAPEKLVLTQDHTHVTADRLIVTSNVEMYDYSTRPPSIEIDPWISHFLGEAFGFSPVPPEQAGRRIHISRKKATWRNIVNQEDVTAFLEKNGFTTVFFEEMSLAEKHQALNGAEIVIGLYGAGFTHLPFCRPGTRVVMFYPEGSLTDTYWTICNHMGLEHYHLICEDIRRYFPLSQQDRGFTNVDAIVNLDHLKKTLQTVGLTGIVDL